MNAPPYQNMKLFKHQQDIVNADPKKCGLFLGTGSGKTITALMLAEGKTLVVTTKTVRDDETWQKNLSKLDKHRITSLKVISKEEARRDIHMYPYFDTEIYDESHTITGLNPQIVYKRGKGKPKTSQVFEAIWGHLKVQKPKRLYLLSATPIRTPMAVLAHAWLLGKEWDFLKFRETFYFRLPMHGREIWSPKVTTLLKERLGKAVQGLGYVGRLSEYLDVPDQTYKTIYVELTTEQKKRLKEIKVEFPDPLVQLGKRNQIENGVLHGDRFNKEESFDNEKKEKIKELALEFDKMVIFAKYVAQVKSIVSSLRKEGYYALELTGDSKDRNEILTNAKNASKCIIVISSQISAGYELPDFPAMVFASMSFSVVDRIQGEGRILRANFLKKNIFITLVAKGGTIDEAIYKSIENKQDFSEAVFIKNYA